MAESIITGKPILIALAGGILPALLWLWFWLKQDNIAPEPRGLIVISFFVGMMSVIFVLPFEKLVIVLLPTIMEIFDIIATYFSLTTPYAITVQIVFWALIEEVAKYAVVLLVAFRSQEFDEPLDAVIYLITAALGFAAMENSFYLFKSLSESSLWSAALDSNLRFIGATILHIASSAFLGIAIALSFYWGRFTKILSIIFGLTLATLLHVYFNLSIMEAENTISALVIFSRFWLAIIVIIILLSLVKLIKKPLPQNPYL